MFRLESCKPKPSKALDVSSDDGTGVGGNSGPEFSALLGDWAGDSGSLHFTLGVDDDSCVIFEVQEVALTSAESLSLSDEHCGHDLLTEIGLTPSHGGEEHVADGTAGEPVEATTGGGDGDNEEGLGASVVSAVDDCCCGETT